MPRHARGFDTEQAFEHLSRRDRKLGTWMKRIGYLEPQPAWRKPFDPVDALARAILYQQLSGKAASTIVGRVETAIGSTRLHFDTLGRIDDASLRACGVSGNKSLALRDLAAREANGEILRVTVNLAAWPRRLAEAPQAILYAHAPQGEALGPQGLAPYACLIEKLA